MSFREGQEEIFDDGLEAGPGDWLINPADGWMITPGTIIGPQYYQVEGIFQFSDRTL